MAPHPFLTHAKAAIAAHKAGDHAKARHHTGHMLNASLASDKGFKPATVSGIPTPGTASDMVSEPSETAPAQFGSLQRSPTTATPAPMGAPAKAVPAGFNRSRFAAMRGK